MRYLDEFLFGQSLVQLSLEIHLQKLQNILKLKILLHKNKPFIYPITILYLEIHLWAADREIPELLETHKMFTTEYNAKKNKLFGIIISPYLSQQMRASYWFLLCESFAADQCFRLLYIYICGHTHTHTHTQVPFSPTQCLHKWDVLTNSLWHNGGLWIIPRRRMDETHMIEVTFINRSGSKQNDHIWSGYTQSFYHLSWWWGAQMGPKTTALCI